MTENKEISVKKSRNRKTTASASIVIDTKKNNDNFSVEKIEKSKIENINLSDLYALFRFSQDMCNLISKEITFALDNQSKEKSKEKYYEYLNKSNKIKSELIKRMESILND